MSQVSRNPLKKKTEEKLIGIFWDTISNLRGSEKVEEFFNDLLTPTEKIMLSKRLGVAILLVKGATYGQISEALNVTDGTIGRISEWMKTEGNGFRRAVEKIIEKEKNDRRFKDFLGIFTGEVFPIKGVSRGAALKAREERELEELPSRL